MVQHTALIVDDEPDIRELIELTLRRMDVESHSAADLAEARQQLGSHDFDLCLTDMRLPDGNGIDLVQEMQRAHPHVPVAVITAHGNMESAIHALKSGAFDFVSKPVDLQMLRKLVNAALKLSFKKPTFGDHHTGLTLLGDSEAIQATRAKIEKLARSQAPVYVSGESGVGKELVARLIHEHGPRADKPFVPVNCGAIPEDLMESEFFGHKKGSFTGALSDKEGLFQAADGGTLFLDEVADLPLHVQVKLLRAIQEKCVRPVGAQRETPVDVRILSATHQNLGTLVQKGAFRQDLFYRINVIELHVPPLRERKEDIPILARHIVARLAGSPEPGPVGLSADAVQALQRYTFPGNVRELENVLERAITLCDGTAIKADDLQLPDSATEHTETEENAEVPLESRLIHVEKQAIQRALEQTRYNKTAAAKLLGISFRALRYRLKKLGLE